MGSGRLMRLVPFILLTPSLALVLLLFLYPLLRLIIESFLDPSPGFGNYVAVVTDPTLWQIIETTVIISTQCTVATLLLAYPVSYLLSRLPKTQANLLMMFVLLPFWTSLSSACTPGWCCSVATASSMSSLISLGLSAAPHQMLYDRFAVVVGMSHFLLPFMVLSLYSTMLGIDRSLIEAASSMGSSFLADFPAYIPAAVVAGRLLRVPPRLHPWNGFYITPALLGSPQETTISVYIQQQIQELNWGEGTGMAVILVAIVVVLFAAYDRIFGFDRLFRGVGTQSARRAFSHAFPAQICGHTQSRFLPSWWCRCSSSCQCVQLWDVSAISSARPLSAVVPDYFGDPQWIDATVLSIKIALCVVVLAVALEPSPRSPSCDCRSQVSASSA